MTVIDSPAAHSTAEALAERVFMAALGAQEIQAIELGCALGWYDALAAGPCTSGDLATATGTAERYARERLEHQAVSGYVTVATPSDDGRERRYELPATHAEVLVSNASTNYVAPLARFTAVTGRHLDALIQAYRSGGGVSWEQLGDGARQAQATLNRPYFLGTMPADLAGVPEIASRLQPGAKVADLGCGFGWSSIGLALAYPHITVHGIDVDAPSIEAARRNAEDSGVADRVRFTTDDVGQWDGATDYDLVLAFECVHDLPDPIGFLATARALAGETGAVVVMDERVADAFTAPGDEVERLMYGFSITCCLPDGMSHPHSAGTGTVMRPSTLRSYAQAAGFRDVEVLDIDNDFFRFYRLA